MFIYYTACLSFFLRWSRCVLITSNTYLPCSHNKTELTFSFSDTRPFHSNTGGNRAGYMLICRFAISRRKEKELWHSFLSLEIDFPEEFLHRKWGVPMKYLRVCLFHGLTQAKVQPLRSHFQTWCKFNGEIQYPNLHPGMKWKQSIAQSASFKKAWPAS